jgi:hypothetical protein
MLEFESFVYLDMEKTGSTFIIQMLNRFSAEPKIKQSHHESLTGDYDPTKFYFISVRDPLDAYLSLYSFGCGAKGQLRARMNKKGHDDYYDGTMEGFSNWLQFVLKPRHAKALGAAYAYIADGRMPKLLGVQSFRYLRLAVPNADALLTECETRDDIRAVHAGHKLPHFTVRYEWFVEDLCELLSGPLRPYITDLDGALDYVRYSRPVNTSKRIDDREPQFEIKRRLLKQMREREWLMAELFGYR